MAGSFSDYAELKILDHALGTTSWTMPTQLYVSLHTTANTDAAAGTEVSGNAYARQAVDFSVAAAGATSNNADVTFPTATGSWGTITHLGLYDAASGGNYIGWSDLAASKAVASGDVLQFLAGEIDVTLA